MLTMIDNVALVLCFAMVFVANQVVGKKCTDMESYYHANKALPWSLAAGTLAASWYGGAGVIGTVGYVTTMGLAAFFIWSLGCHLIRFPLALWVAPRISIKVNSTMTELLERFYGPVAAVLGAFVIVIPCMQMGEIASAGYIGVAAWGANKFVIGAAMVVISILLSSMGGLMGVAITDMIFFFFMIGSVALVFPNAFFGIGGWAGIESALNTVDPTLMTPFGGISPGRAIVLLLICLGIYKDPAFYQRFTASNGPKTGKRAMLACFTLWLSMDLCLMVTALIIRAMDPALTVQPEIAYIELVCSGLPPFLKGVFVFAMLGAIISTMDSYYLLGGEIVANDIVGRLFKKQLTDKQSIRICRITCVAFGVFGLMFAFNFAYVYDILILFGSIGMSVLFVPMMAAIMYNGKKTDMAGLWSMIAGAVSWLLFKYVCPLETNFFGVVDPMLVSLPFSFIAFLIGNRFGTVRCMEVTDQGKLEESLASGKEIIMSPEEYAKEVKVEWFGVDGLLVLVYLLVGAFYCYGIIKRVDWIIGWACPIIGGGGTALIFLDYLLELSRFGKKKA